MTKINRKKTVEENVYDLALRRVRLLYERFDKLVVSFSGGKDSTACVNVCLTVARELGRLPLDVFTLDEEAIPPETVEYMERIRKNPDINFKWCCLPIEHRNACSRKSPFWYPWDPEKKELWVRDLPDDVITIDNLPAFHRGVHPEEVVGYLYGPEHGSIAQVLGIRTDESLTRFSAIANSLGFDSFTMGWGSGVLRHIRKAYPIYDWKVADVWVAPKLFGWDYNRAYDRMEAAGLTRDQARCSPPYGEQPIERLWSYKTCWPDLWSKMVDRVPGAATAARYANTELYGTGVKDTDLPKGATWQSHTLDTLAKLEKHDTKSWKDVARGLRQFQREHRSWTTDPMPEDEPHPRSGYCWKFLFAIVAAGGDKNNRQTQKIGTKARGVRTKNNVPQNGRISRRKRTHLSEGGSPKK